MKEANRFEFFRNPEIFFFFDRKLDCESPTRLSARGKFHGILIQRNPQIIRKGLIQDGKGMSLEKVEKNVEEGKTVQVD